MSTTKEVQWDQWNPHGSSSDVLFFPLKGSLPGRDKGNNQSTVQGQEIAGIAYIVYQKSKNMYRYVHIDTYIKITHIHMSGKDNQQVSSETPWINKEAFLV